MSVRPPLPNPPGPSNPKPPAATPDRRGLALAVVAFLAGAVALNLLFLAPSAVVRAWFKLGAVNGETLLLVLTAAGFAAPARRLGSRASLAFGAGWTALWVFEIVRQAGFSAMGEAPLLYDLAALLWHLFVLARDLYGAWVYAAIAGALATVVVVAAFASACFAGILGGLRQPTVRWATAPLVLAAAIGATEATPVRVRWTSPTLAANVSGSWALYRHLQEAVTAPAYEPYEELKLRRRPDIRIYVIESYGRLLDTQPQTRDPWRGQVRAVERRLRGAGWTAAAAWGTAPVSGGRSWIADASLMLGLKVSHQSEFTHAMTQVDELVHLPRWLAGQGYETVLVRPKDRERPGVKLDNSFRFGHVVFHDELGYQGPTHGWGVIPDQYTIGFVQDEVLAGLPSPTFTFLHLVTSHVPWEAPPLRVASWRDLLAVEGSRAPKYVDRDLEGQLDMELRRFQREERPEEQGRKISDEHLASYWGLVSYDLDVIAQQLEDAPSSPTLVLIMGDHQPPLVGGDPSFDVPLHLFATDPALLEEFLAQGFAPGAIPPDAPAAMGNEGFYSLLVRALARYDGQDPPPWYPRGAGGEPVGD